MDNAERDQEIVRLYVGGPMRPAYPASKLAAKFGISVPQVRRILAAANVQKSPEAPKPSADDKVIDEAHRKLGHRLYSYRFGNVNDVNQASAALGWSVKKLRGIEQGHSEITLSDLQDMSEYMKIPLSELMRNI